MWLIAGLCHARFVAIPTLVHLSDPKSTLIWGRAASKNSLHATLLFNDIKNEKGQKGNEDSFQARTHTEKKFRVGK